MAAIALACGALAAGLVYPLLRIGQVLRGAGANPADVAWTMHAAFTWRGLTALYAGGLATIAFFLIGVVRGDLPTVATRVSTLLPRLVLVVAALFAVQTIFAP